MKKTVTILILFGALLLALLGAGVRQALRAYERRPVDGGIEFDPFQLPESTWNTGDFVLRWIPRGGGRLVITHTAEPDRVLWSTPPGRAFAAAAIGEMEIRDSRGMFRFRDHFEKATAVQTISRIEETGDSIQISGVLSRTRPGAQTAYTLRFHQEAAHRLAFDFRIEDNTFNRAWMTWASEAGEQFHGFGEQFTHFNHKGNRVPVTVMEQGIGRGRQPLTFLLNLFAGAGGDSYTTYAAVPHYITSRMRSVFLGNYVRSVFDLRRPDCVQVKVFGPRISGVILHGNTPAELITRYTAAAGRMRPLPDWILSGAIAGMQGGTEKVRDVWEQLKQRETPLAAFWLQDWVGQRTTRFGRQLWWNWTLDRERYPDWEDLVSDLEKAGTRVMTYVNPFLADLSRLRETERPLFSEAAEKGFLVKDPDGGPYMIQNTDFSAAMLDLTNPEARDWMRSVIREEVIGAGASGWMADFGEALPFDAQLHSGEDAARWHNRYPEAWARLNREVIEETGCGDDFVFFTRAGYRNSPRFSTLFWEGDQLVTWDRFDGMKSAVTGLLSAGLSGYAFNHSDIGGYTTVSSPFLSYHRSRELLFRWMEMNAFTTIYRTHEGIDPEASHQFYDDGESLDHFSRFAKVYAAWAFYRRELVREAAETGLPVVRHPFIHFPDEPNACRITYEQFMTGSEFMIVPVLDPGTRRVSAWLPAGKWQHLWSGEVYGNTNKSITVTVDAPLGKPGVFYREGSGTGARFEENLRDAGMLP
jgi:sulfoquinovosidase